jgi:hypothetical protein
MANVNPITDITDNFLINFISNPCCVQSLTLAGPFVAVPFLKRVFPNPLAVSLLSYATLLVF